MVLLFNISVDLDFCFKCWPTIVQLEGGSDTCVQNVTTSGKALLKNKLFVYATLLFHA